jgi:hypothetical protein
MTQIESQSRTTVAVRSHLRCVSALKRTSGPAGLSESAAISLTSRTFALHHTLSRRKTRTFGSFEFRHLKVVRSNSVTVCNYGARFVRPRLLN